MKDNDSGSVIKRVKVQYNGRIARALADNEFKAANAKVNEEYEWRIA